MKILIPLAIILTSALPVIGKNKQPNLIIMSDDAGYADFGFMGSEHFKTPNLDKLAKEGTLFTQTYATPTCSPMDRGCGKVIDLLDKKGVRDNTYILFLNDNGGDRHTGVNTPLRDYKGSVYEGSPLEN